MLLSVWPLCGTQVVRFCPPRLSLLRPLPFRNAPRSSASCGILGWGQKSRVPGLRISGTYPCPLGALNRDQFVGEVARSVFRLVVVVPRVVRSICKTKVRAMLSRE